MKRFLTFIGGFIAGVLVTLFVGYLLVIANKPIDGGLIGLTVFPQKEDCLKNTSKSKSTEVDIFQVLEPNMALGNIKNFTDKKLYGGDNYRDYDIGSDVVVLLINYDGKTYYDDQKMDVSNKCLRQIGTYRYATKLGIQKTVPAVVIE
jgi:hypothetical protein